MPLALVISSHVAASRVGGTAQAQALAPFRIDTMVVPTVLYGRHPGWGAPGGASVPVEAIEGMLDGIEANGLFAQTDLVLTGYFASAAQVRAAARAIDAVRAAPRETGVRKPIIIVDPTIGDAGKGLYVAADVADAVIGELVPRADIVAPNAWELQRMTGAETRDPTQALHAARLLGRPVMVSSVQRGGEIGVIYADKKEAWLAAHPRADSAPKGTGDLLSALFGAALIDGLTTSYALARAVGGVAETISAAQIWNAAELPVVAMAQRLKAASPTVRMERLI
ncbi:MAG: bifunctional hydroxymethylpyrimidine kinase/phosphomethylpyrimidine kinase [Phenylobacterium sp.]|uniref:bifunctional hydroxymethylpyrimidine kinase/phosphomethylpyrimidine kinase n=1 Tax=Phenylobacterium sp. TaxID=1871053 RepID=UPI002727A80A|nr:bifunctional hydroxymethylpyrimidine kinase/phosphomethylpyrimidine kinase [Phenylobacterium sp.]MDO8911187.1 bifunctional hydroxymethylpyrimidine kinase/phosphomethylpyrimidine kinase [Phenylobacterium sp.]MDP2008580.1 bifunctional hydroxymethylpyrimidine kinase/phosphomethylpyrimidine kinase [Phenylobacterium sp.]MDP3101062.1 bifunctional hydroxymethylpyrimidine kinase/phosphomethylpyrimidine kinase [Phenylobacterium sp.]MDP3632568.1 bifunctional hydroxymethylpyrimidine kinase/phosphomethy